MLRAARSGSVLLVLQGFLSVSCGGSGAVGRGPDPGGGAGGGDHVGLAVVVAPSLTVGEDVTDRERARNAESVRPPPTVFRRIEISTVPPPGVQRFDGGFRV